VLLSLVIFWKLPESLHRVSWLSGPEKGAIQARLDRDVAHHDPHEARSVFRAMVHPLVLVVGLVNFLFLGTTYAFTLSGPQILGHLTGFNPAQVGYLTAAGGLSGAAAMILNAWHSDHTGERFGHLIAPLLLIGAGFAALALSVSPAMAIAGYLATMIGNSAFNGVFFATFSGLLSPAKLVVGVAAANMIGQLGSFFLPSLFGLVRQGAPGDAGAGLGYLPLPFLLAAAVLLGLAMTLSRRKAVQPAAA
jgi:predicted MFS family arabinose efflux permease